MARADQPGVVTRSIIVTDLSQLMKKQRDFLKWMARKYQEENPDQAAAFTTGAQLLEDIRGELVAGAFDAGSGGKDLFTVTAALRVLQAAEVQAGADMIRARLENAGQPGFTSDGYKLCGDAWCDYRQGHEGRHSDD